MKKLRVTARVSFNESNMLTISSTTPSHLTEQSPSARLSPLTLATKVRTIQQQTLFVISLEEVAATYLYEVTRA